jgi:hypothetical protein
MKREENQPLEFDVGRWMLNVGRFSFIPHSFLHRRMPGAYVPNLMRSFLRKACLVLATGSLVFFLSCERHHVGELPDEHETKAPAEEHATTTHESHASPSPAARNTPANFFPDKPKP